MNKKIIKSAIAIAVVLVLGGLYFNNKSDNKDNVKNEENIKQDTSVKEDNKPVIDTENTDISGIGTILFENNYKSIKRFNKNDIAKMTGVDFSTDSIESIYSELSKSNTWQSAGYSKSRSDSISDRFSSNKNKSISILREIANNSEQKELKVIIIHNKHHKKAEIGIYNTNENKIYYDSEGEEKTVSSNKLEILDLDIQIEYDDYDVQISYEVDSGDTIEAKIEIGDKEIIGTDAQNKIEKIFNNMNLKTSDEKEILNQVISKLDLNNSYKKFKFDTEFINKTDRVFSIKN